MSKVTIGIVALAAMIGTPVLAADMALKAPPPPPAPVCFWCGWYVGVNAGYGWGGQTGNGLTVVDPIGLFTGYAALGGFQYPSVNPRGAVGGGQIGYNWQTGSVVLGVVADIQASGMRNSQTVFVPSLGPFLPENQSHSAQIGWFGTARGRLGYAASNSFMPYVSGGLAYGETKSTLNLLIPFDGFAMTGSNNTTRAGWTVGGGLDYAVAPNVIVGVDYLYMDLGHSNVTAVPINFLPGTAGTSITMNQHFTANVLRATLDFKFH
jgi:outer membrane immunogenic protein